MKDVEKCDILFLQIYYWNIYTPVGVLCVKARQYKVTVGASNAGGAILESVRKFLRQLWVFIKVDQNRPFFILKQYEQYD